MSELPMSLLHYVPPEDAGYVQCKAYESVYRAMLRVLPAKDVAVCAYLATKQLFKDGCLSRQGAERPNNQPTPPKPAAKPELVKKPTPPKPATAKKPASPKPTKKPAPPRPTKKPAPPKKRK